MLCLSISQQQWNVFLEINTAIQRHGGLAACRWKLGMSEFCDSARAELGGVRRINKTVQNCKILQILFSNIALSSALMAATACSKHFGVKVIKYFAVLRINAAVTGVTISNCNKFLSYMHSVTSVVSWHQKRQRFIELCWPPVENNTKKYTNRNAHSTELQTK